MECKRCGNIEKHYFYQDGLVWYCRKCIHFGRMNVGEVPKPKKYSAPKIQCKYSLPYCLTKNQEMISKSIRSVLKSKQKVLVYAACGAGKTEIVMDSIERYINKGKKVGYAISRRQVVLEIADRMQEAFSSIDVVRVCEGYTTHTDGDLIVCTMHQLYRYYQTFDLLIMDEIDAFPYAGNVMLEKISEQSCRGEILYLTATPSIEMLEKVKKGDIKMYELFVRPHGYPLIVPKVLRMFSMIQPFVGLWENWKYQKQGKQVLMFVPTIAIAKQLYRVYRLFFSCFYITSKSDDKENIMLVFKEHKYQLLVCTTILERGITIEGVNVVILYADHPVFNEANLIQMVGRVGRKKRNPFGDATLICMKRSKAIIGCIRAIKNMNEDCVDG